MADGTKKPAFVGQALLLLTPVIVLLVIGLNSLRQDRIQAHREAEERAKQFADSVAAHGVAMFIPRKDEQKSGVTIFFQVDASGKLLFPPPVRPLTPKQLLASELTTEQAALWRKAQVAEAHTNRTDEAIAAYTEFLQSNPPVKFAGNALYSLGLLHGARGDAAEAVTTFSQLLDDNPEAFTEGGMPLKPLAMLKLLDLRERLPDAARVASTDSVSSNLIYYPTPLTRSLLRQVGQLAHKSNEDSRFNRWLDIWNDHERIRGLYAVALSPNSSNILSRCAFWFTAGEAAATAKETARPASQHWLAVPIESSATGCLFACYPERQARNIAEAVMTQATPTADYFAAEIELAGQTMATATNSTEDATPGKHEELLASALEPHSGRGWVGARVYLAQPASLYRHQRVRRFWFGALIATCAIAALVGLVSSWRAFKRQQRLNELRSNFVSSVSHELRTPVASVRLLVEGLASGRVSGAAKQKEYLQLMGQECRRLSGLIDNILDFSRIDDGRKQFEFSATDVEELVSETVKIIEPVAAQRKVSLACSFAADPTVKSNPPILDGLAIRQALLNLIDNAIKHSPEGSMVTVGVGCNGVEGGGQQSVSIWVVDKGAGIPLEEHEKIFERFYRRGSELNRGTQGIGIGLTIVKHIVEAHGGRVLVQSTIGAGSKFTMEFPLNREGPTA